MGLIRTILALVILLILVHVGLMYANIGQDTNVLTNAVYSLGTLVESPASLLLNTVTPLQQYLNPRSFYVVAFTAAAVYLILYVLLGVGRRALARSGFASACRHDPFDRLSGRSGWWSAVGGQFFRWLL